MWGFLHFFALSQQTNTMASTSIDFFPTEYGESQDSQSNVYLDPQYSGPIGGNASTGIASFEDEPPLWEGAT